ANTTLAVAKSAKLSGAIGGGIVSTLTVAGPGTLQVTGASTYTGATVVSGGTLTVGGAAGSLASTSNITVNQGSTLTLDNTAGNASRANAAAPITLNGGT